MTASIATAASTLVDNAVDKVISNMQQSGVTAAAIPDDFWVRVGELLAELITNLFADCDLGMEELATASQNPGRFQRAVVHRQIRRLGDFRWFRDRANIRSIADAVFQTAKETETADIVSTIAAVRSEAA